MKLRVPNKINYLVLLTNKKKKKLSNLHVYHHVREILVLLSSFKMMELSCYIKISRKKL